MVSTLWFIVKTSILISLFMWLATLGGHIAISFQSFELSASLGVFLVVSIIIIWIISIVVRAIDVVLSAPQAIAAYNEKRAHVKGMQALAYGLSAVAAGDVKHAKYYTKRTSKYLKNDFGLSKLLGGLTAKLSGNELETKKSFEALLDHKETSFLGLKGLMQTALDKGDFRYARVLAKKAYDQNSKQAWIIKSLYDLEVKTRNFAAALPLLKKLEKTKAINKFEAQYDRATIYLTLGEIEKSYKVAPLFLPIGLAMLNEWSGNGKRRKSISLIKKLWLVHPHPKLVDFWIQHAPKKTNDNIFAMIAWIEDLYQTHTGSAPASLYIGQSIVGLGQKDQAKRFIREAIKLKPTIRAYQLMNQIDTTGQWMDNVAYAHQDESWVCAQTGKVYGEWVALTPDHHFNSVRWGYVDEVRKAKLSEHHTSPFFLTS